MSYRMVETMGSGAVVNEKRGDFAYRKKLELLRMR